MSTGLLTARQKSVVGLAGASRAASAGMLATVLIVYVGRQGSPFALGLLAAVFFVNMTVFAPLWGILADLTGRRRQLLVGLSLLATLAMFAFVLARSVWDVIGFRGLYAVFAVGFGPLVLSLVCALVDRGHRGRAAGFLGSSLAVGDMIGQIAIGVLLGLLAAAELYLVIGTVSLVGTLVLLATDDPPQPDRSTDVRGGIRAIRTRLLPPKATRAELHSAGLTWLFVGLSLRHVVVKGVTSFVPVFLLFRIDVAEPVMGLFLAIAAGGQLVFQPLAGRLADRSSRKRLVLAGTVASGGFPFALAAATVLASRPAQLLVAGGSFLLMAGGFAALDIGTTSLLGDLVSETHETTFLGLQSTAHGIGGIVGPTLMAAMVVAVGYERAFLTVGLLAFVATALIGLTLEEPARTGVSEPEVYAVETASGIPRPTDTSFTEPLDER